MFQLVLGYAFQGSFYCGICGETLCELLADCVPLYLAEDSNHYPQPVFNVSDVEDEYCTNCGAKIID